MITKRILILTIMALVPAGITAMEQKEKTEPAASSSAVTVEKPAEKIKSPTIAPIHRSQNSIENLIAGSILLPGNYLD